VMRYGNGTYWVTHNVSGEIDCRNKSFGNPIISGKRRCQFNKTRIGLVNVNTWATFSDQHGLLEVLQDNTWIRYGTYGKPPAWIYYQAPVGNFSCTNVQNDNPRDNAATLKECQVGSWLASNVVWKTCAKNNGACNLTAVPNSDNAFYFVRYGSDGTFRHRLVSGIVDCSQSFFGNPHSPSLHCDYKIAPAMQFGNTPTWTKCAGNCTLPTSLQSYFVCFGVGNTWSCLTTTPNPSGSITVNCDEATFGCANSTPNKKCRYVKIS